jgi:hypothetical protein
MALHFASIRAIGCGRGHVGSGSGEEVRWADENHTVLRRATSILLGLSLAALVLLALEGGAQPAPGPGGWERVGTGATTAVPALNGIVYALNADAPGVLYVGGNFTDAGGIPSADRIARWDGAAWQALGAPTLNGDVHAIAYRNGKVYAGGVFSSAGGNSAAGFLAVWDGRTWSPVCRPSGPGANVYALAISGSTLYIGGAFQNGAGIPSADYLLACDLNTGAARALVDRDGFVSSTVEALAVDGRGTLYAGGGFVDLDGIPAADWVAAYDGRAWRALGTGAGLGGAALTDRVRALAAAGTAVYAGGDAVDIARIPQADNVARWNGSAWSALGANKSGGNGIFPPRSSVYAVETSGSRTFVGGLFQNANGDPLADNLAVFDGTSWAALGSNGAGGGALNADVQALAVFQEKLYAGGRFTSAGGLPLAHFIAAYPLAAAPPGGGGGGGGGTTTTTPAGGAAAPPTATATGTVTVNGRPFTAGTIPFNATVDVTRGTVVLRTDTGTLRVNGANGIAAAFVLVRGTDRGRPVVELRLARGNFAVCPRRRTRSASQTAQTVVRQLWGNGRGRFRTRGRYASATVRGTRWLTADRCDGTQTRVTQGVIEVRDIPRNRLVTLRAGRSYLARP